jgi:hypothetical protein
MGFTPEPTHYKLVFTQPQFAGLEVTVRAMSVLETLDFDDLRFAEVQSAKDLRAKQEGIAATLASVLVGWNVESGGSPWKPDCDSLMRLENPMVEAITTAWLATVSGSPAAAPLDQGVPGVMADAPMQVNE